MGQQKNSCEGVNTTVPRGSEREFPRIPLQTTSGTELSFLSLFNIYIFNLFVVISLSCLLIQQEKPFPAPNHIEFMTNLPEKNKRKMRNKHRAQENWTNHSPSLAASKEKRNQTKTTKTPKQLLKDISLLAANPKPKRAPKHEPRSKSSTQFLKSATNFTPGGGNPSGFWHRPAKAATALPSFNSFPPPIRSQNKVASRSQTPHLLQPFKTGSAALAKH